MSPPSPRVPFVDSRYLGNRIFLDELGHCSDKDLCLLDTEVNGLLESTSQRLKSPEAMTPHEIGITEKLMRTAGRFAYAIEQELSRRQRQTSILEILRELDATRKERDLLRQQLATGGAQ